MWGILDMTLPRFKPKILQSSQRAGSNEYRTVRPFVRILLVEDDLPVRNAIQHVLANAQYKVVPAQTGEEALKLIRQGYFDMVLTDVKLPGVDGVEVIRQAKQHNPRMPVLVVSGVPDPDLETRALGAGATFFLRKPLGAQELQTVVAGILERRGQIP
jgi:DNA-binding response OmpR family regulator